LQPRFPGSENRLPQAGYPLAGGSRPDANADRTRPKAMKHRIFPSAAVVLLAFTAGFAPVAHSQVQPPAKPAAPPTVTPPPDLSAVPDFGEVTLEIVPKQGNRDAVSMTFIKIPAGTYRRGTTEAQRDELKKLGLWSPVNGDELPAKEVRISKPFLLGKYEVTQGQWVGAMAGVAARNRNPNPSAFKSQDPKQAESTFSQPVESVSWDDTWTFLARLKELAGGKATYRLPTEAEWEYAARAGGDGPFGLGADKQPITVEMLPDYAAMSDNADNKTQKVGQRKPNAWGLCDMLGNVWEWCMDGYSPTAYATLATTDPSFGSATITERVMRGGCWFLDKRGMRVSLRGGNIPTTKNAYIGFRIVRELP
jgi:formylglycine-generating enzyme required for sulfatase activity